MQFTTLRAQDALESLVPSVMLMHGVSATWKDELIYLDWFGDKYEIDLEEITGKGDIASLLLSWAVNNCKPNLREAEELGGYKVWNPIIESWQLHISRGINANCVMLDYTGELSFEPDVLSPDDFTIHLSGTILEVRSTYRCSGSVLSLQEDELKVLFNDIYEINENTRCLIRTHDHNPVLFGHELVIERLGSSLLEDYMIFNPTNIFTRRKGDRHGK